MRKHRRLACLAVGAILAAVLRWRDISSAFTAGNAMHRGHIRRRRRHVCNFFRQIDNTAAEENDCATESRPGEIHMHQTPSDCRGCYVEGPADAVVPDIGIPKGIDERYVTKEDLRQLLVQAIQFLEARMQARPTKPAMHTLHPGDTVEVRTEDGSWCEAVLLSEKNDGSFTARYAKDGYEHFCTTRTCRRKTGPSKTPNPKADLSFPEAATDADNPKAGLSFPAEATDADNPKADLSFLEAATDGDVWFDGIVCGVKPYGIFVRLQPPSGGPSVEGLVHVSEMLYDDRYASEPEDVASVGDELRVRIKAVKGDKVELSMKSLADIQVDTSFLEAGVGADVWFDGIVSGARPFGLFVKLQPPSGGPRVEGLLHISEMSYGHVGKTEDVASVGDELRVRVKAIEGDKVAFSMKSLAGKLDRLAFANVSADVWLSGTVVRINENSVIVSAEPPGGGVPSFGVVPRNEIRDGVVLNVSDEVAVGQHVQVRVLSYVDDKLQLSMRNASSSASLSFLEEAVDADVWFDGIVSGVRYFGLIVTLQPLSGGPSVDGLLHVSELTYGNFGKPEDVASVGDDLRVRVIAVKGNTVLLSMKSPAGKLDRSAFANLSADVWFTATVVRMNEKNIVVSAEPPGGGVPSFGVVPRNEIPSGVVADEVAVGKHVQVRVLSNADDKLQLSMRSLPNANLSFLEEAVGVDKWFTGVVTGFKPYGIFVKLKPPSGGTNLEGLVHVSETSYDFVDDVEDMAAVGDEISVRVKAINGTKIHLSLKSLAAESALSAFQDVPPDVWLPGTVTRTSASGGIVVAVVPPNGGASFVGLVPKAQLGLVPHAQIQEGSQEGVIANTWDEAVAGQHVQVRVVSVADGKLRLSMRNPASSANLSFLEEAVDTDKWFTGVVSGIQPYGVFVDLQPPSGGPTLQGLVRISEIPRVFGGDVEAVAGLGDEISVRVKAIEGEDVFLSLKKLTFREPSTTVPLAKNSNLAALRRSWKDSSNS
eukprot:TRINITY_DN9348_c0_g1_i16.p1 TRINITY_DN9348_c0_g1~~TRINITY_DN9348_c0_g1_i16.p1  ORF type:complete len:990 (+),score=188.45 TRINITY_DN9348_c0_g1_i16:98-3067(+)